MTQIVKDVITWLKQWFYDKDEVDDLLDNASGGISSYRNYEIIPSTYTPTIDSNISITINVTNMSGNPVANESVSLVVKFDGLPNITISDTTDANGSVTLNNVQMVKFGVVDLRVGATHCQLNVDGWKQYYYDSATNGWYIRILYNETHTKVIINDPANVSFTTTETNYITDVLTDSWIRPLKPISFFINFQRRLIVREGSANIVKVATTNGTGNIYAQLDWAHRGIP